MARTVGARRTKVKTGCGTCRIRKVKCDEDKPSCQKCVKTGRKCDGYDSPFRNFASQPVSKANASDINPGAAMQPIIPPIAPSSTEVDLLNHYFSTKTMFDVKLGCDEEARQVLQASLTDPPIRHAVSSLKSLRQDFETSRDGLDYVAEQTEGYKHGLRQYSMALSGLASQLSSPDTDGVRSALLCCQVLISIEQVRANFDAMALHIIRGLGIMHEYRARPSLAAGNELVPAYHNQLPFLDVFIVKLFAAPCRFAERPQTDDSSETTSSTRSISPHPPPGEFSPLRTLAPNMRKKLVTIATSTLEFLSRVSLIESVENALQLVSEKATLLASLESWLSHLELVQAEAEPLGTDPEPLKLSFLRLFHLILKTVLLGALDSSPDLDDENKRLQAVANDVGARVRVYLRSSSLGGRSAVD